MVTFSNAFALSGYQDELPAGNYEVVVEEELLLGLGFQAYRRTATYLTVRRKGASKTRTEMRPITEIDLQMALSRDRAVTQESNDILMAPCPPEDLK